MSKEVWALRNRDTGFVSTEFDVTGWDQRNKDRLFSGLVMQVDFERWELVKSEVAS